MANLDLTQKMTGLIGGLGFTRVDVYKQRLAPDGLHSGCPHIHAICAEAYYVLEGSGFVELHSLEDGFKRVPLNVGTYFQFPPNVLHRIVSSDGLVVLGLMSNSGLAENGDARIYFGEEIDQDSETYNNNVRLIDSGLPGALERRDRAVSAYQGLVALWESDQAAYFEELRRFIDFHQKAVFNESAKFEGHIQNGPLAWGQNAQSRLNGELSDFEADGYVYQPLTDSTRMGMCGVLKPVQVDGTTFTFDQI